MSATCRDCDRAYLTSQAGGHCTTCHESFTSNDVFDSHRVGRFDPMERRCLTVVEMHERGWVEREMGWGGRDRPRSSLPIDRRATNNADPVSDYPPAPQPLTGPL